MPLSFHGFSFDLFGFSRRLSVDNARVRPDAQSRATEATSVRERENEDAPEVSFRALCIFPIL